MDAIAPEPRKRSRRLWKAVNLIVSLAAGWGAYEITSHSTVVKDHQPIARASLDLETHPLPVAIVDPLFAIDDCLCHGMYLEALQKIRDEIANGHPSESAPFAYREALAQEMLGKAKESEAIYAKLVTQEQLSVLAELGLARCFTRQKRFEESRAILHRLEEKLRSGLPSPRTEALLANAVNDWMELGVHAKPTPFDPRAMAMPVIPISVDRLLPRSEQPDHGDAKDPVPPLAGVPKDARHRAMRSLKQFLEADPTHPSAVAARVLVVALDEDPTFRDPNRLGQLKQVLHENPENPAAIHAAYNCGLLQLERNEFTAARESFLQVVDRGDHGRWEALGWWWVARTYLDSGDIAAAVKPLQQILRLNEHDDVVGAASIGLAAIRLYQKEPQRAFQMVETHRRAIRRTAGAEFATLIELRCRYLHSRKQRPDIAPYATDLIEAIAIHTESGFLGPLGLLIVGDAANDVGLGAVMKSHFVPAVDRFRGPLAIRMTLMLGEHEFRCGSNEQATQWLTAVAAVDTGDAGLQARCRLCELALRGNAPKRALQLGQEILFHSSEFRDRILPLLGKAYAMLGDHARAAMCFGGEWPET